MQWKLYSREVEKKEENVWEMCVKIGVEGMRSVIRVIRRWEKRGSEKQEVGKELLRGWGWGGVRDCSGERRRDIKARK